MSWFWNRKRKTAARPFDWNSVPMIDKTDVECWMGVTDAVERQFPLQVALQVHDEVERILMKPGDISALRIAELRGQLMALSRFAKLYSEILNAQITQKGGDEHGK